MIIGQRPNQSLAIALAAALAIGATTAGCDDAGDRKDDSEAEAAGHSEAAGDDAPSRKQAEEAQAEGDDGQADRAESEPPADLEPGDTAHFGDAFERTGKEPVSVAEAISTCSDTGDLCRIRGRVNQACEKRGCWMTLEAPGDVDEVVRVRMLDYGFFVPANIAGAEAIIEGEVELTEVSEDRARHYAEHEAEASGEEPRRVTGPEPTYRLTARAIELRMPES